MGAAFGKGALPVSTIPRQQLPSKFRPPVSRSAAGPELTRPLSKDASERSKSPAANSTLENAEPPVIARLRAALPGIQTPVTHKQTFGEVLPGVFIESIVKSGPPTQLTFCVLRSNRFDTQQWIQCGEHVYIPQPLGLGLVRVVRFPPGVGPISSGQELVNKMKQFFSKFADLEEASANILIGFTLATWFVDCFEIAPVLHLFGPEHDVSTVLRLLNCVCYHPVLLADLGLMALRSLPAGLRVTLLINQADLAPKVERALLTSTRRSFHLATGNQPMNIFGAQALYCDSLGGQVGLNVSINPARRQLPRLTEIEERAAADEFQARLLAYRMIQHPQVQKREIDAEAIGSGLSDQLRTWSAAIPEHSDLQQSVLEAFTECRDAASAERFEDPNCLVAEAALMFCHRTGAEHFFVGELAEKVNDLLAGRRADCRLEDRKVGSVLRKLDIQAERATNGFRVKLDQAMRKRIHRIAAAYQSLSVQPQKLRCGHCKEFVNVMNV